MRAFLRDRFARARWPRIAALTLGAVLLGPLTSHASPDEPDDLRLVHLAQNTRDLTIPAATQAWLAERQRTLRVGVVPNIAPPFDIVDTTGSYFGITADLLDRLRSSAHLRLTFKRYPDTTAMLAAARRGDIDLATTIIQTTPALSGLRFSRAYFPDQDSVVERNQSEGFVTVPTPSVPRLAYVPDLVSAAVLRQHFPRALLMPVHSPAAGLTAVAFGQADQYVGNTNISNYLIERLQLLNLSIRRFTTYPSPPGFQLAAPASHAPLIDLVDRLIAQIDIEDLAETRSRWEGRPNHVALDMATVLSPAEKAWIQAHPVVYFAAEPDAPPFLFHDDKGEMAGVTADMMNLITTQVGIRFKPSHGSGPDDVPAILPVMSANAMRPGFVPTSPYSWSGFAVVTRTGYTLPNAIGWPAVSRIAIPNDGIVNTLPSRAGAPAHYVVTPSVNDALHAVNDGNVDAAILNINIANYYIAQRYQGKLVVAGYLEPADTAQVGFGVPASDPELALIIDKVLQGTREARLNDIRNHWNYTSIPDATFRPWRQRLWAGLAIAVSFGLLLLAWNRSLARQIQLRQRAETALRQQFALQQTLLDSMPFPFFICDVQLRLSGWNQAFAATIGPARCVVGSRLNALTASDDTLIAQLTDILQDAVAQQVPLFKDTRLRVNGHELDAHAWVVPFVSDAPASHSLLCGWMDVSERGEMQRAAKRAQEEAEHANHAKSTFLATISHEIRTPMNAILGILELQVRHAKRQTGIPPEDVVAALESARSLVAMLDEILDISKIEAGKLTIDIQPVYLNSLTDNVAAIYEEVAKKKGVAFRYTTSAHDWQVMTDAMRLRQILSNLLSNAIKFTARGAVSFRAHIQDASDDDATHVDIHIVDTGIGIEPATIPSLLEPYTQAAPDIATHYGGTGLGLPICNHLTTALGGKLTIESTPGRGTHITLRFILQRAAHSPMPTMTPAAATGVDPGTLFQGCTALIVDDHPPNRIVLSRQLQFLGFDTIVCTLAGEALAALERTSVDVLITDCNMPGMSGFELARSIRRQEKTQHTNRPLTIVGFTASLLPETLHEATTNGMDTCLIKPLALDELASALQPLLHRETPGAPGIEGLPVRTAQPAPADSIVDQIARLDPASESKLLRNLIATCEADITALHIASQTLDYASIGDVAHRLHSTAELCRLPVLAQLTDTAESLARSDRPADPAELAAVVQTIVDITRRLIAKLQARLKPEAPQTDAH
ncbi:ATP-binding protein [Burkholderia sp. RF2-non_BP3]|uniref:ATP-binding protein n=1 Tax=Burkholderia sp. RF2-non_BP3 TaxID=1637844 RepID=UPI00075443BA|nr:transporter substrate-binding domain-containing protein [Burkholderia sp. RF2-non_BP3]KUY50331.1 hypothetical protein WS45_28730 [Burkholderia sp. RF2-non_BP3]